MNAQLFGEMGSLFSEPYFDRYFTKKVENIFIEWDVCISILLEEVIHKNSQQNVSIRLSIKLSASRLNYHDHYQNLSNWRV